MGEGSIGLVSLNYKPKQTIDPLDNLCDSGRQTWLYSRGRPILIHNLKQLAGRLNGVERFDPAPKADKTGEAS